METEKGILAGKTFLLLRLAATLLSELSDLSDWKHAAQEYLKTPKLFFMYT